MRISIVGLLAIFLLAQEPPRTVQHILGKTQTQAILKEAMAESVARAADTYLVTKQSIEELEKAGVPPMVLEQLEGRLIDSVILVVNKELSLLDKEIEGKDNFLQALRWAIGEDETRRYGSAIIAHTQGYLILDTDFEDIVTARVLSTKAPDKDVRPWLEKNFRKFLSNYVLYLKGKSDIRNRLTSHEYRLADFLQNAKCGEIECTGVPPCCGKLCDPCTEP